MTGEPQSGNGASSFHLWWEAPFEKRLTEVSGTLEIVELPDIERLVFWAIQVSFVSPGGGGAHLGLQHNPRFPGSMAANWGGYAPAGEGGLLEGSPSALPSMPNDPNTRDFAWYSKRPYRLAIERSPDVAPSGFYAWRGSIEDLSTAERVVVRDLYSRGEYLRGPVAWTESFARCDHPSFAARWSDLVTVGGSGEPTPVATVKVSYQERSAGGCDNTNVSVDGSGWEQRTGTERTTPTGARLSLPRAV